MPEAVNAPLPPAFSKTFAELAIGDEASIQRLVTADDFFIFAHASGNHNPLNLPADQAATRQDPGRAPSMWLASLFSAVLGNILPGPGTTYETQNLRFLARAYAGDELTIHIRVTDKIAPATVVFSTQVRRGDELLVDGVAEVQPPAQAQPISAQVIPGLTIARHRHIARLLAACASLPPMPTAVVAPEDEASLLGPLEGYRAQLIKPILIGDEVKIRAIAAAHGADLSGITIENIPRHDAAAARGVEMVHQGLAAAVMKGALHTDELLKHVVKSQGGLRSGRRISHVFIMDVPYLADLLLISDAAINIAPTLEDKVDITQNAIDLGIALGIQQPKVGILAAVEVVNPKMPATLDAAALSKMAERGQIRGGIVDGPLAMDNAISLEAAKTKGLASLVAGRADILIAPNLEAGNILAKELTYAAQAEGAGIVLGATVPVLLTSRADNATARLFSCVVAALYEAWARTGVSAVPPVQQTVAT
jgi:phosphate butyryltransferase